MIAPISDARLEEALAILDRLGPAESAAEPFCSTRGSASPRRLPPVPASSPPTSSQWGGEPPRHQAPPFPQQSGPQRPPSPAQGWPGEARAHPGPVVYMTITCQLHDNYMTNYMTIT